MFFMCNGKSDIFLHQSWLKTREVYCYCTARRVSLFPIGTSIIIKPPVEGKALLRAGENIIK